MAFVFGHMIACRESALLRQQFSSPLNANPNASGAATSNGLQTRQSHVNVAKLMFIHMLGYPSHFGQMECLKLIATSSFVNKRVGYLALMLLLDEKQEVLMMATNAMKVDIESNNPYVVGIALSALGSIGSTEMCCDLAVNVSAILKCSSTSTGGGAAGINVKVCSSTYVRKKALLCSIRVVKKLKKMSDDNNLDSLAGTSTIGDDDYDDNGIIEDFVEPAMRLFREKHHGVLLGATTLVLEVCKIILAKDRGAARLTGNKVMLMLEEQMPLLIKILKALIVSSSPSGAAAASGGAGGAPGAISDPFLQVTILQLLRIAAQHQPQQSDDNDALGDILAQVVSNINTNASVKQASSNAGNAVLYECVKTIMGIPGTSSGLRTMAINVLGKFLKSKDKNIRYVALNTLASIVNVDDGGQAVQRHRGVILSCVQDNDASIRRRALELVYALVTSSNIVILAKELIDYLLKSGDGGGDGLDYEFRLVLCEKICSLIERLSPDAEWRVQTSIEILAEAGEYIRCDGGFVRKLIAFISNTKSTATGGGSMTLELQQYAARTAYIALRDYTPRNGGVLNGSGGSIKSASVLAPDALKIVALYCMGEYADAIVVGAGVADETDAVVDLTIDMLGVDSFAGMSSVVVREYALTALAKMSGRFGDGARSEKISSCFSKLNSSTCLEIQQRAVEYFHIITNATYTDETRYDAHWEVSFFFMKIDAHTHARAYRRNPRRTPFAPPIFCVAAVRIPSDYDYRFCLRTSCALCLHMCALTYGPTRNDTRILGGNSWIRCHQSSLTSTDPPRVQAVLRLLSRLRATRARRRRPM